MLGLRQGLAALAGVLLIAGTAHAADVFTITSTAFKDGGRLPAKMAGNNKQNPNCVGENVSPQLSWSNPPAGTKSYVLLMSDPEGRAPAGVSHWVAYGIPASVTGFAEGETSKASPKYVGGLGTSKQSTYQGPCTPAGPVHHYTFTLVATTLAPTELPPGPTREQFFERAQGKLITSTGLIGLWKKK